MAITLTSQMTDVILDPGSPTKIQSSSGNAQASETDIQLQGSNCAAIGHSGSLGPTSPTALSQFRGMYDSGNSVARADTHIHIWVRDLYPIRNVNVGGISVYLSNTTNDALYYVSGLDKGYGGGWFHAVVNLDTGDRPAASLGTAPSGNITEIGYGGNISASKGEDFLQNCYFDAIRSGTGGQGITLRGGTSGTHETFLGCVAADTASYGIFRDVGGAFFIEGPVTWGLAANNTYITENLQTLNFTNYTVNNGSGGNTIVDAVASDYYRIVLADGTTSVTSINFTDITFKGVSRTQPFSFTSNLGTGDNYTSLRSTYIFGATLTFNSLCSSDSDVFVECDTIVPNGITLTNPTFSNCDAVTLTAANDILSGGATNLHNTLTNVGFVDASDFDDIENHSFDNTSGVGHAIDLGTISATRSDDCDGNQFTGYSTTVNGNKAVRVSVNSGQTYTINVIGGSNLAANLVYNAGTGTVVVQNAVTVQVTVLDNSTGSGINLAHVQLFLTSDYSTSIMNGATNASGVISTSYAYGGDVGVEGWARQFDISGTDYVQKDISGTITSNGLFLTVRLDPVT